MVKHYQDIIGAPVLHFEEGSPLATVKDAIINPDTGKLEALWVKPAEGFFSYGILQTQDIVEWKKNCYIRREEAITEAAEVIKISEILADGRQILGNRVKTESGEVLGRVADVDFETEHYYLKHLYTEKRFLFWRYDRRILSYDLILEVLPDYILMKEQVGKAETVKEPLVENQRVVLEN